MDRLGAVDDAATDVGLSPVPSCSVLSWQPAPALPPPPPFTSTPGRVHRPSASLPPIGSDFLEYFTVAPTGAGGPRAMQRPGRAAGHGCSFARHSPVTLGRAPPQSLLLLLSMPLRFPLARRRVAPGPVQRTVGWVGTNNRRSWIEGSSRER